MAFRVAKTVARKARKQLQKRQQAAPTRLKQLAGAFTPTFVLPEGKRQKTVAENIQKTAQAVGAAASARGISLKEAGRQLRQVRQQLDVRDRTLSAARREGISSAVALTGLKQRGIDPALLKPIRSQFVTPEGSFEAVALPGGTKVSKRRLKPPSRARPRPTPSATPTPPPRRLLKNPLRSSLGR